MKCLIIAAGYATRLYPLTENFPKPLLKVGEKTILDWLIDDLEQTGEISEYIVVTNHKFAHIFEEWAASRVISSGAEGGVEKSKITILDDGTSTNETRLGAVCDVQYAIEQCAFDDDLLVMAGDNLLSFSLGDFIKYFRQKGTTCIMRYWEGDPARLRKSGIAEVDDDGRILSMEEKPANPRSNWACPPFYIYRREDVPLVALGIAAGCGTDAPGSFIAWLCTQTTVHAWQMPGPRYDIGNLASYEEVKRIFEKR